MSVVKLQAFGGMLPAVNERLLPPQAAVYARNTYLYNGTLIGWRQPRLLFNLSAPTTRMAFRIPVNESNRGISAPSYWLEFAHVDTKVLRTPVIDDTFKRYYYFAPDFQPAYNTFARIAADLSPWLLGVPAPTNTPGVTPAGGTGANLAAARSYVYTYVTAYGEESAPSPPIVQNGFIDDTWVVTLTPPTANDLGVQRNIATTRIYRTVTATDGTASFFLVAEVAASTTSYADSLSDATVAQSDLLASTTWTPPPVDLQGTVSMANGILAGFRENEVWFSEPFRPHTFPSVYTLTTEFPIVGLAAIGQSLVVCTKGYPVVMTGASPDSMTSNIIHQNEPCNNSGSIAAAPDGVYYSSPRGLQLVTSYGTMANVTLDWIDNWPEVTPQQSLRAIMRGYSYFAYGSIYVDPTTGLDNASEALLGVAIETPQTASQKVRPPQGTDVSEPAFSYLTGPNGVAVVNFLMDMWTAVPYLIQDQKIYYFDYAQASPTFQAYKWKSKVVQDSNKRNFSCMRVWFNIPDTTTPQNADRNTNPVQTLADDQYGLVRVYADGALLTTRELRESGELLRIRSGQKYEFWQWEFEGHVEITEMQAATTVKELSDA